MNEKNLLEIRNLDISFGGVHAVNHLSFDVVEGECLGLIGPNGSGKSTCVNMISGLYKPDGGEILFQGENVLKLTPMDRAFKGIGRTFQSPKAFEGLNVLDSIYTASLLHNKHKSDAQRKTDEILSFTGLEPLAMTLCSRLPIEKRKWLDMARVLAINPKLIMLDECLAGLNPSEMEESISLVRKINRSGGTVLFIEHVMRAVASLCSRVVVLDEGKLLSQGPPNVIMNEENVIAAYLGEGYKNVIKAREHRSGL